MQILIVDDEPFFIEELKRIINKFRGENGLLIEDILEAYSGEQALQIIQHARPDVVFTDIRMASIDGLELAQTIQRNWPNLPVIIVSGYPSFDYAREAIRAQVVEYLLKPIDEKAMNLLLTNLYAEHALRNKENISLWLQQLIELTKPEDLAIWQEAAPKPYEQFMIGLIRTQETLNPHVTRTNDQPQGWPHDAVWNTGSTNRWDYLVFIGFTKEQAASGHVDPGDILPIFIQNPELISFIYTPAPVELELMAKTIENLYQQLDLTKVIGSQIHAPLLPTNTLHSLKQSDYRLDYLVTTLSGCVTSKDAITFHKEMQKLFQDWHHAQCNNHVIEQGLKHILRAIAKHEPEWTTFTLNRLNKHIEEILVFAHSFEEVCEAFCQMMSPLFHDASEATKTEDDSSSLYLRVTAYLTAHLSEPLTMNDVIDQFELSRTSIWSLFRQHGQTTFIEYLTNKRLEKAKELIKHFDTMKLKDIAEQVGYMDHHYFSRIFKSVTGQTPTEFRNQHH
jgi:two-component system response regulator YesN